MSRAITKTTEDPFAALAARKEPLTTAEAAAILQVGDSTLRGLIRSGDVEAERTPQGYRIDPALFLRYLRMACEPRFFVVK